MGPERREGNTNMTDTPSPTPPSAPPTQGSFDANRPTIISLLYLGGFLTGGLTSLVGIVLGHVWNGEQHDPWMTSHFTYLIRTFWIALIGGLIAMVLNFTIILALIGIPMIIAIMVWVGVRSIMSLLKAQKKEPMPDPETFLF